MVCLMFRLSCLCAHSITPIFPPCPVETDVETDVTFGTHQHQITRENVRNLQLLYKMDRKTDKKHRKICTKCVLPIWQTGPENPGGQTHMQPLISSKQVAPFKQGSDAHSSISGKGSNRGISMNYQSTKREFKTSQKKRKCGNSSMRAETGYLPASWSWLYIKESN